MRVPTGDCDVQNATVRPIKASAKATKSGLCTPIHDCKGSWQRKTAIPKMANDRSPVNWRVIFPIHHVHAMAHAIDSARPNQNCTPNKYCPIPIKQ
jgi:hypothetical protein